MPFGWSTLRQNCYWNALSTSSENKIPSPWTLGDSRALFHTQAQWAETICQSPLTSFLGCRESRTVKSNRYTWLRYSHGSISQLWVSHPPASVCPWTGMRVNPDMMHQQNTQALLYEVQHPSRAPPTDKRRGLEGEQGAFPLQGLELQFYSVFRVRQNFMQ